MSDEDAWLTLLLLNALPLWVWAWGVFLQRYDPLGSIVWRLRLWMGRRRARAVWRN